MSLESVTNGKLGPAYAYYGTAGAEATVGFSEGGMKWQVTTTTAEVKFDQRGVSAAKKIITGRGAQVTLMLAEDVLETYQLMFPGTQIEADTITPTTRKLVITQNVGLDLLTVAKSLLIKPQVSGVPSTDENEWVRFYKAVPTDVSPTVEYNRDNQRIFEVVFDCFPDSAHDYALGVIGDESADGGISG